MRSIWAVATNTIKQALRMKVAVVFVVLLIILLPVMGLSITGDGTLKGKLQTFVSYGLSLTSLLLCLLTIIISIYSLTNDIKQKQIYTVLSKPIRRFELILGKLLGVILLDVVLLALFSAIIYSIIVCTDKFSVVSEVEHKQVENEFFTARATLAPGDIDVTKEVNAAYKKLKDADQLPKELSYSKIIDRLTRQKKIEKRAAGVGQSLVWEFHNVKRLDPDESLFIRFAYDVSVNPPDLQIYGGWDVGDYRQLKYDGTIKTPIYSFERKDVIRTSHEIEVPANAVAEDGFLAVRFVNLPLNNTVVIFPPGNLEVHYKAGSFTTNFIKAVILIFFRLVFLAVLGMLSATFLSFPVAILFCFVVFFTATISGFIFESFNYISKNLSTIYYYTMKPFFHLLPQFDKYNPAKFLVPAKLLSWALLAKAFAFMVCIKSVLMLLLALLIFSYREVAKIIV